MRYKSSLTKEVKLSILIIFFFWVFNIWFSSGSNSIGSIIEISLLILIFTTVFIYALIGATYVLIEDNKVKYIHMFLRRGAPEIRMINGIRIGLIGGVYKSLLLVYSENEIEKEMKIGITTFKKNTLKQLILDLKSQNNNIEIDKSVDEFFL